MNKSTVARRADLDRALKAFKKGENTTLEEMALLWGVTKARFINVRSMIADFPEPVGKQGNVHLYPAKETISALIRHEKRNDEATGAKANKIARILGVAEVDESAAGISASEALQLSRARADILKRKRELGELVPFGQVQQVLAEVFGEISQTLGKLSDNVDPNGRLPGTVRMLLDGLGKDLLLRTYARLTDMLPNDADSHPARTAPTRARPNRARRGKVRRKSG